VPIDPERALQAEIRDCVLSWTTEDVILYQLAVGAGAAPTVPGELEYVLEDRLKVLASFAVIPGVTLRFAALQELPGVDIDPAMILHGEQDLEIFGPLPPAAEITHSSRVTNVFDKGKGAIIELETTGAAADKPLFRHRTSAFVRGEGGFGGPAGPRAGNAAPDRAPDIEVESATLPQQALLYRLTGDRNPLHADPEFAKLGGFDQPILHGMCSYGIVCKAVVDEALDGDVGAVARYQARFAGVVFPGETIVTRMWREDDDRVVVNAHTKERGSPVITNAAVTRTG
jgi:acyl dehydratase